MVPDKSGKLCRSIPIDQQRILHGGVVPDGIWRVETVHPSSEIVFKYEITPSEHYPHALSCTVRYQLVGLGPPAAAQAQVPEEEGEKDDDLDLPEPQVTISAIPSFFSVDESLLVEEKDPLVEGLRVELEVENLQDQESWVGLGTHLYFRNPFDEKIDSMNLSLKAIGEVPVDDDTLIPIHPLEINETIPLEHDFDGLIPRRIGETEFDNSFLLDDSVLEDEPEGAALITLEKDNFMLEIIPEFTETKCPHQSSKGKPAIQFAHVYTPPARDSIAIEPQTCPANHFQHPYDAEYNNNVLRRKGDKLVISSLFIITWSFQ